MITSVIRADMCTALPRRMIVKYLRILASMTFQVFIVVKQALLAINDSKPYL
jgi:hypothetical protein